MKNLVETILYLLGAILICVALFSIGIIIIPIGFIVSIPFGIIALFLVIIEILTSKNS